MRIKFFVLACLLLFSAPAVKAGIRPSFALEYCAWQATDIVVATEGEEIDGNFTVLETLKGGLYTNQTVFVPELASFKSEESRLIKDDWTLEENKTQPNYVSGARMILFLKKDAEDKWKSASFYKEMNVSVVWLEADKSFAFMQLINPGASLLVEYGKSESEIKKTIFELNAIQDSVKSVLKIRNKTRRAEELAAFSDSDIFFIREEIFAELQKCGEAALPVFRKMLADESLLKIHGEVIESMAAAGGGKVGNELTSIIREELKFWKETAPRLETGWWNNINDAETENLRNRYSKVLEAIRQLTKLKFAGSRKIVTEFRDFWRSLPQLEDKSGLNQMSEECDDLLKAISSK